VTRHSCANHRAVTRRGPPNGLWLPIPLHVYLSDLHHRDTARLPYIYSFPAGTVLEVNMSWRGIADAAIEAIAICGSLVTTILVGLPVFLVLAAIVTALLGVQPPDNRETVATKATASTWSASLAASSIDESHK
jgi:hypothetical protein